MNYKEELNKLLFLANMALDSLSFEEKTYVKFLEFKRQVIDDLNYIQEREAEADRHLCDCAKNPSPYGVSPTNLNPSSPYGGFSVTSTTASQGSKRESAVNDAGNIADCRKESWTEEEEEELAEYIANAMSFLTGSPSENIKVKRVR